ncbi:multidrug efflux SMR transporter [Bacillaceae bacterium SIJ1]|uniref:DMT family transporter n=1 Tax=Litoribacterium kuwaitense TaxID=1398745 RepID=UPI0013ED6025|nr:multidrug efflux SMR transporter [Litoribacterium kuwaitense]NGP45276.1 multidrug efflux SMR transporter [Litoribacterium kuwaitense]
MSYLFLGLAIVLEVFGSTMLKLSEGLRHIRPTIGFFLGFGLCFYFLSFALKSLPLGIVYATWSGVGTILTVMIGVWWFQERLSAKNVWGLFFLVAGLIVLNSAKG